MSKKRNGRRRITCSNYLTSRRKRTERKKTIKKNAKINTFPIELTHRSRDERCKNYIPKEEWIFAKKVHVGHGSVAGYGLLKAWKRGWRRKSSN